MKLHYALAAVLSWNFMAELPAFASEQNFPGIGSREAFNRAARLGNKANELAKKGDIQGSTKLNQEANLIYPFSSVLHRNLGEDLEAIGKLDEAAKEQQRAIELEPNMFAAWLSLGLVFEKQKKFKDAERCYRKSVQLSPNDYGSLGCLGDILRKQGKFAEAKPWLLKAKSSPGCAKATPGEIEKKLAQCDQNDSSD